MKKATVERKIHFYRANAGRDESGDLLPFDLNPALTHINCLAFDTDGRYLEDGDRVLCCWVDQTGARCRLRLGNIRRSGLPQLEQRGDLSELPIPADSGLAESIHVVGFPDNIIGADFNFYGPRMSRLGHYLAARADGCVNAVSFEPLVRQDITEQLRRLEDVRLFQLKIRASFSAQVAAASQNLGAAFEAAAKAGDAEELEIVLRPAARSRNSLSMSLVQLAGKLLGFTDIYAEASRFVIRGKSSDTERVDAIDLLSEHLIAKVNVVRQSSRGRALDSTSVYDAIEYAYHDLHEELIAAAGLAE